MEEAFGIFRYSKKLLFKSFILMSHKNLSDSHDSP